MSKIERVYKVFIKGMNEFIVVDKEFYYKYYRPLWAQIKRLQRIGEFVCPKNKICFCDGDWLDCKYHKYIHLSLDEQPNGGETSFLDTLIYEEGFDFIDKETPLSDETTNLLDQLNNTDYIICNLLLKHKSLSEIGEIIQMSKSGVKYRISVIQKTLQKKNVR